MFAFKSILRDLKDASGRIWTRNAAPTSAEISAERLNLAMATPDEKKAAGDWNGRSAFGHARQIAKTKPHG